MTGDATVRRSAAWLAGIFGIAFTSGALAQPAPDPKAQPDPAPQPTDPTAPPAGDPAAPPAPAPVDPPQDAQKEPASPPEDAPPKDAKAGAAAKDAQAKGDAKGDAKADTEPEPEHHGSFSFGSYGRMIAATDARGGPGRDADIVARGSRLDESNYVELELRRDDDWAITNAKTRLVATLAFQSPVFHYNGEFDANIAVRNLYIEERDLGIEGLRVWAGSRMVRGDDIYLLDWWPLDNLNAMGAGVGFDHPKGLHFQLLGSLSQPNTPLFTQTVDRPAPLNQFGSVPVQILDRQRFIGAARAEYDHMLGDKAGIKGVLYSELHQLPSGQRETEIPRTFEKLPSDGGFTIGGQIGTWTGERDTHLNLYGRYSSGLAAYGQFSTPSQLDVEDTTSGASEIVVAAGGNVEFGPIGVLLGTYIRSFRNASPTLDYDDLDEGIVALRPSVFFGEIAGLAVEGSYQRQQRGVVSPDPEDPVAPPSGPKTATVWRLGFVPFLSPAGRGSFSRPQFRFIYVAAFRDDIAKQFYPQDHVFGIRDVEHFVGMGAEWWFNSTTYDR
jgi:hypothetical protein